MLKREPRDVVQTAAGMAGITNDGCIEQQTNQRGGAYGLLRRRIPADDDEGPRRGDDEVMTDPEENSTQQVRREVVDMLERTDH